MALIAICDLIVSIDSGPVHVAGAVGNQLSDYLDLGIQLQYCHRTHRRPRLAWSVMSRVCSATIEHRSYIGFTAVQATLLP